MRDKYIDMLIKDHALIEKGLLYLTKEAEKTDEINIELVNSIMEFMWEYGFQCHNMKEETAYFPLLIERGMPQHGPLSIILVEHKQQKAYIENINSMISQKESGDILSSEFKQTLNAFCILSKEHLWKENDILFPMGKNILKPEDIERLYIEFLDIEKDSVGEGGYLKYLSKINSLENC
jgi:uncharacterized protein